MKNYPHIISKVYRDPWCILPAKHQAIRDVLEVYLSGERKSFFDDDRGSEDDMSTEPYQDDVYAGRLIIPICGIIGQHLSGMEIDSGGCSLDRLESSISQAEDDGAVKEILFRVHSPGGTVTGVPEMADRIAAIEKPVIAFTDSMMCSAAYYLMAGVNKIYCTPSADVGSIGVYSVYSDYSRMLENDGIKINALSAGKSKLMGAWFKPMTDDERKILQAEIDKIYRDFKAHVSTSRPDVPDEAMQGNVFDGKDSVDMGLVDGLVSSIDDIPLLEG